MNCSLFKHRQVPLETFFGVLSPLFVEQNVTQMTKS